MPDYFADRFEREVAFNGPEWIRLLWSLWAIKQDHQLWVLVQDGDVARSPSSKSDAVVVFPSESVALDAAHSGWRPAPHPIETAEQLGPAVEVWPSFQPAYHSGTRISPKVLRELAVASTVDVRSQLATPPSTVRYDTFEPMPALAALIPMPDAAPKLPRPRPAAQVNGILGSPAPSRFKFMHSNTFWVVATPSGPLGAILHDESVALCAWPGPEFIMLGTYSDLGMPVKVGWGQDILRPLVETNTSVLAAPNAADGLLCSPVWFAMPDLNMLQKR